MPAIAMTDHGNLFGAVDFYTGAKKYGLKPIIGCEVYVAPEGLDIKKENYNLRDASHHLVLLVKDDAGYKNLLKMITVSYLEGFYYKPRIDKKFLADHVDGLIALSSCGHGEVALNIAKGNYPRALKAAQQYKDLMGEDNFYLELQDHKLEFQEKTNEELVRLGKELSIPIVATNNCHYMEKTDSRAHEILICLQTGKTIDDPRRMQYLSDEYYFKSAEEMTELFKQYPEAIENTIKIAERCNLDLELGKLNLPEYPVPEGFTLASYLEDRSKEGLKARFADMEKNGVEFDKEVYESRLNEELQIIKKMGYPGYFLIVWDFIDYARKQNIPVGPGRGSAAGSLVAYVLKITDLDPIPYDLLFERFLNPERVSMPDIDIDFCIEGREEVIKYVTQKYGGSKNVTQIITFGALKAKAVIRDVGRVLGMTYGEVDKIAKMVPNRLDITLKDAFKEEPGFAKLRKESKQVDELLDISLNLEGLNRHCSTHAAGVVISSIDLTEFLPLYKGANDEIVTQFAMKNVDKLGLLKMDFLGLRTLTVIHNTLELIKSSEGVDLNIDALPMDDDATFKLLSDGKTRGVFQLESSGMRDLLKKMKPDAFEDIIALLALYRPGPMGSGMIDDYVKRKHGTLEEKYDLPQLKDILQETHGVILYQEQVMKIANVLAGFTLGDADLLRRAMGKKDPDEMAQQREKFMSGSGKNKITEKKATKIFDLMEKFAGYGFNKSHSAAYALISYQTAYLKAHYPLAFFGALITSEMGSTDKVIGYINDCRDMGIEITPPDVNVSGKNFSIANGKLIFGLGAIKNVGMAAIDTILEERDKVERFPSLSEFCQSNDMRVVNKRVIESLIKSGAFDSFGESRAHMMNILPVSMETGQSRQRDKEIGQGNMFDLTEELGAKETTAEEDQAEEWSDHERLKCEKETLGFYVSGHPLVRYEKNISWFTDTNCAGIAEESNGKKVSIAGIPYKVITKNTRKGDKMGIVTLEDLQGTIEVIMWPEIYAAVNEILAQDEPILIRGTVDSEGNAPKVIASEVYPLSEAKNHWKGKLHIQIRTPGLERDTLVAIKDIVSAHKGSNQLILHFLFPDGKKKTRTIESEMKVSPSDTVIEEVEAVLGEDCVRFE
jgi:DNA polymerase-3 subunit alpha